MIGLLMGYHFGYDRGWKDKYQNALANPIFCSEDVKECPDGSSVGRIAPRCEFATCASAEKMNQSGIEGTVVLGDTACMSSIAHWIEVGCPETPYQATLEATTPDGAGVFQAFSSDINGAFRISLPPGDYALRESPDGTSTVNCSGNILYHVASGEYTAAKVDCEQVQ